MSAGIQELDKGYVEGTTWHGIPSYITLDRPVTIEEARSVMCYPLEKQQLFRDDGQDGEAVDAWAIVRTDHDAVMVPAVGKRFEVVDNSFLLNFVHEHLLAVYPELVIESCGTLFNGATAFVNIKIAEFQIKGDKSPTVSRLMYYNPLGRGSYQACAHDVRIVCNNTLRAAAAQGKANKSLAKFRHTASAGEKINEHLMDLAEFKLDLKKHIKQLDFLAKQQMSQEQVFEYLNKLYPLPKEDNGKVKEGRSATRKMNQQNAVMQQFEMDQSLAAGVKHSAYGLLQATTHVLDHGKIKGGDEMAARWDGIVGQRAAVKDMAVKFLLDIAA